MQQIGKLLSIPPRTEPQSGKPKSMPSLPQKALRGSPLPGAEWSKVTPELRTKLTKAFQFDRWPWYLHGPAGSGKSYAAACIYNSWDKGWPWWCEASKIIPEFVKRRIEGGASAVQNSIRDCGLIVLDDVAIRECTPAQAEAFLMFINLRGRKPFICTGNIHPTKLSTILDDRIASRLTSGVMIGVEGSDRRLEDAEVL